MSLKHSSCYQVALITERDIKAEEELLFCYNKSAAEEAKKKNIQGMIVCYCGDTECLGFVC